MNPTLIIVVVFTVSFIPVSSTANSVFLLAGQSNMAGRGGTYTTSQQWDGVVPEECRSDPRILRLNNASLWEQAAEPLHGNISLEGCPDSKRSAGVGPGMAFANALLERADVGIVGLVPCAAGGTNISEWGHGGCLYERLLSRAHASLRDGGALRGMLWYQGENDALNEADAKMYGTRLRTFFDDIRSDLMAPSLPIIQVALASPEGYLAEEVRRGQLGLKLPNVTCIDAAGLPLNGDNLHLTTDAQVKLGAMFAEAFLQYLD